ncbi:hypothetical protein BsWGS_18962 [Bradybaena similaris]
MLVPLDKMHVASDKGSLPSLHPSNMEKMAFVRYTAPPVNPDDRAECDVWLERVNYLCDDLHWLLQLPHDKFWCQVVFDASLHKALDSFLQHSPRSYDILVDLPEVSKQRQLKLSRLVFMTYLRMSTHKESKDHFITPEVFGEILYNNFLFDMPKIFDICSLFGKSNCTLLSKMVGNIFTQQPKYTNDLHETIPTIIQVFSIIAAKCGINLEGMGSTPQKLDQTLQVPILSTISSAELQDIVLYLSDTAVTLHLFLDIYPAACSQFQKFHFCSVIASFYESVMPEVTMALKQHEFSSASIKKQLISKLRHTKKCLLNIFRSIVQQVCIQPMLENPSNEEIVAGCTEEFLHTMSAVLAERRFLTAYEGIYNFQDDRSLFVQASSSLDDSQFEYIQSAINSAFATFGRRKPPRGDTNTGGRTSPDGAPDSSSVSAAAAAGASAAEKWSLAPFQASGGPRSIADDFQSEDYGEGAVAHPRPSDVEIESLISSVKDLFPHIGEGFVEIALEELDWDQERVVSCILEEKLPPSLQAISQDLPRLQREPVPDAGKVDQADILDSRRNVFDNDEFDMFGNKRVDMTKIHLGKKEKKVDLNDKSIINAVRATYDVYGSIDKASLYDAVSGEIQLNQLMYEDEYDDTYDSNAVGADDADSADELTNKKILPRVLMDLERKKAKEEGRDSGNRDDDDDDEDEVDENSVEKQQDSFVTDPAKLREQAEQRRQSQAGRKHKGRPETAPVNRDVKGNPKGQGQGHDVLRNRHMKEKFKGQRHRVSADKKMSKGMF